MRIFLLSKFHIFMITIITMYMFNDTLSFHYFVSLLCDDYMERVSLDVL